MSNDLVPFGKDKQEKSIWEITSLDKKISNNTPPVRKSDYFDRPFSLDLDTSFRKKESLGVPKPRLSFPVTKTEPKTEEYSAKDDKPNDDEGSGGALILLILFGLLIATIKFWPYSSPAIFFWGWLLWDIIHADGKEDKKNGKPSKPSTTSSASRLPATFSRPKIENSGTANPRLPAGRE